VNELLDQPMPETDAPKMEYIKFAVPAPLLEEMLELAEAEGWKPAELHRFFWVQGFAAYAEGSNKRGVNRSLRSKRTKKEKVQESESASEGETP
jgi:hypothetical protein